MISWSIIAAVTVIVLTIYHYATKNLRFFEKNGIPHLKPTFLIGNMGPVVFKRISFAEQIKRIYDTNPSSRYFGFHDFTTPTIMLRDLDVIKHVTVKNFDCFVNHTMIVSEDLDPFFGKNLFGLQNDNWREMRSILSPAFTSSKMKAMFDLVSKCGRGFADNLAARPRPNVVELKDSFTRYTMDVIASAAFGLTVDSLKEPDNEFYLMGRDATTFDTAKTMKFFMWKLAPRLMSILRMRIIGDEVENFFTRIVSETVRSREIGGIVRNDMIQLMMQARDSGKASEMTMADMTAQAFIFFFGGFDTTSTAMCFAAHEIAVNAHVQEKLQREIDDVLEACGGEVTWEAFQGMRYLEAVVNEALRKYPPAAGTDRVCNRAVAIPSAIEGGEDYVVEPGTVLWLPYYGLHHDERYFEKPEIFDPERFIDPATGKNREPRGFLPFGAGPRFCIGQRFAMMEVKLAIFHVVAKCRLEICDKTRVPIVLSKKSFTMTSEHDFWVRAVARK